MTPSRSICPVCSKPIASADGAAKVGSDIVHGACFAAAKAKRDAETRAAKEVAAEPPPRRGLLRRLLRRRS